MRYELTDYSLHVIPEGPADKAFLRFVLGVDPTTGRAPIVKIERPAGSEHDFYAISLRNPPEAARTPQGK